MRIYLRLLVVSLLLFVGNIVYAEAQQEKRVTGTVTSEGEPLPGVSVQLKGASSGTITDIDGNYSSIVREGYTSPNPIAMAMMDQILLDRQKLTGSIFADVTLMKNLTWHTEFGYDISYNKGERYQPKVDLGNWKRDRTQVLFRRITVHSGN